jgi:hypothetical protein
METIEVRAEVTTTEFERGAVWDADDDDRTRALIANGYVTRTAAPVVASEEVPADDRGTPVELDAEPASATPADDAPADSKPARKARA